MTAYVDVNGDVQTGDFEKIAEIEPRALLAFGVDVSSRYGKASEIISLLRFLNKLSGSDNNMLMNIKAIYCDSKSGEVSVTLHDEVNVLGWTDFREYCDKVGRAILPYSGVVWVGTDRETYYYTAEGPDEE